MRICSGPVEGLAMVGAVFCRVAKVTCSGVRLERPPSNVGTPCAREPFGAVLLSTLRLARSETHAGSTGVSHWT